MGVTFLYIQNLRQFTPTTIYWTTTDIAPHLKLKYITRIK